MKIKKIINLSMMIFIIIALFLVTLTGCNQNSDQDSAKNNEIINSTDNDSSEENLNFTTGDYYIQIDTSILKETDGVVGDESIEFLDNNTFNAYTGFGNGISGTYTISNNKIDCIADTFYSEYGPNQEINALLSFKINSESEIEIINTSESYEINIVDIPNNSLTDETKDMSLWPFVKGIKFSLSK